jgi:hypothetical protein
VEGLPIGLPTIGEQTLASFYIAGGIYLFIFAVRYLLDHSPWLWTEHIPRVTWVILSLAVAIPICIYWQINQVSDIFALAGWEMKPMVGYICTGIAISVSSNLIHLTFSWMGHKRRNSLGQVVLVPESGDDSTVPAEENSQAALVQPSLPSPDPAPMPEPMPVAPSPDIGLANSEVVYLFNQCDTDASIGPHFALAPDGKLYRVEHGKMTHLPNGHIPTP